MLTVLILVLWLALSQILPPREQVLHHQPTLSATGIAESPHFEREASSEAIQLAERREIRPNELPVGVRSNGAMGSLQVDDRLLWQPADSSILGSPMALRSTV